ncbi:uncharacterized protein LOC136042021 [Artemia franciscana]|uniref:uncharacterized protein LOC136042021 n=1 Tax=Artemia franciscana TaxID=6661 RepID=UPI0032D9AE07
MSVRQKDIDVTNAEIRLSAWFASEDIPFIKANTLIPVLKACAPDSAVLKNFQMKQTKITGIVKNVLAPYEQSRLSHDLRKSFYSLVIDETTDRGTIKSLVIIVKYKHPNTQAVKEEFLGILEVEDSSSLGQKTLIVNYLKKLCIPLNRMISIGFDNASVNTGVQAGLGALLIAGSTGGMVDDALPELFVLGCTSHSLALVASHASKRLPEGLEPMLRDLMNYVANSPKRIVELKEIQQFTELKVHRMLQISNTRWLSMEQAISRVLEQWNALVMFFTNHGLGDAAGDKSSQDKAAKILSYMKEPLTNAYFHFLAFTLNKINCLNLEFQSSDTRIHKLLPSSKATMKSIMKFLSKLTS